MNVYITFWREKATKGLFKIFLFVVSYLNIEKGMEMHADGTAFTVFQANFHDYTSHGWPKPSILVHLFFSIVKHLGLCSMVEHVGSYNMSSFLFMPQYVLSDLHFP